MTGAAPQLSDFGHEPEPAVLDLLRALTGAAPPTAAALDLVADAASRSADKGIQKLLPLVRGNAELMAVLPTVARLAIEKRYLKARNDFVRLEGTARLLADGFAEAGIPILFLKGFALAGSVYPSPAQRPMGDLDLAVPHERFGDAAIVLQHLGFTDARPESTHSRATPGLSTHAFAFRNEARKVNLDLHYNILNCSLWERADDGFWSEAVPLGQPGFANALTLAPEHQLFHACLHGYSRSLMQLSIRWMLDAHFILARHGDSFRWDLIETEARRHRCGPLLAATLGYLAENLNAPVPAEILARLASSEMPAYDQAFFRGTADLNEAAGFFRRVGIAWNACQRQAGHRFATPLPFIVQMARRWGAGSPRQLAGETLKHLAEPAFMRRKRNLSAPGRR
jgi:hypothetical protein